jgi:hypothetical protein
LEVDPVNAAPSAAPSQPLRVLQQHFLTILPRIELHARVYFRHLKCPGKKEDAVAETLAVAWEWYLRAIAKGKDVDAFVSALAGYAARHVRSGRKIWGKERRNDVLSPVCQQRHSFAVGKLAEVDTLSSNPLQDALADNTRSPVPEQVSYRIDFPNWLASLGVRNRRLAEEMALGRRTLDLAARHSATPGRISQLRREFRDGWRRFCGDALV